MLIKHIFGREIFSITHMHEVFKVEFLSDGPISFVKLSMVTNKLSASG